MPRHFCFFICLSLAACLAQAQPREVGRFSAREIDFIQYQVPQANGPAVDYYISKTKQPAPLVLFIQGFGCTPAFTGLGTPNRSSNVFGYLNLAFEGKSAACGTAASVPILSTETMASELAAAGRDVTMRRIPNAGQDLLPPGAQPPQLWPEYQRIINWFEQVKSSP